MSDDTKHPDQHHIPTPAEVRAEHPTVLVPAHPDDEVRRIESHDGDTRVGPCPPLDRSLRRTRRSLDQRPLNRLWPTRSPTIRRR